jgi:hypothetical protein
MQSISCKDDWPNGISVPAWGSIGAIIVFVEGPTAIERLED